MNKMSFFGEKQVDWMLESRKANENFHWLQRSFDGVSEWNYDINKQE